MRPADGQYLASLAGPVPAPADEREAGFRPVECERCGASALVAKFTPRHTSVQWSLESVRACAEFSARVVAGEQTALIEACAGMRASIDRAVLEGRLAISPP
ncbi:MAG TPA: hypothetical protein VGR98_22860 [Streptosporangiaceae bacterium]|nr:hypothetical protein [Streptosporangiaceae bacterium]